MVKREISSWSKANRILKGRNKGRNVIVLGIFMMSIGAAIQTINQIAFNVENSSGLIFIMFGGLAFGAGLSAYLSSNESVDEDEKDSP